MILLILRLFCLFYVYFVHFCLSNVCFIDVAIRVGSIFKKYPSESQLCGYLGRSHTKFEVAEVMGARVGQKKLKFWNLKMDTFPCVQDHIVRLYTKFEVAVTSGDRAKRGQSFGLYSTGGRKSEVTKSGQYGCLRTPRDSLIPKWPKPSKSDENWQNFNSTFHIILRIQKF